MEKDFERRLSHSSARVIFSTAGQTGLSGAKMQKHQKCKIITHEKNYHQKKMVGNYQEKDLHPSKKESESFQVFMFICFTFPFISRTSPFNLGKCPENLPKTKKTKQGNTKNTKITKQGNTKSI